MTPMCFLNAFSASSPGMLFRSSEGRRPEPRPLAKAANERHRHLVRFNESPCAPLNATSIPGFVDTQATRTPDSPAVRRGREMVSYQSLMGRAQQVARLLGRSGVKKGDEVALFFGPTIDLPSAMLGIWGVGAICVPLPFWPVPEAAIEGFEESPILTARRALDDLPVHLRRRAICLERRVDGTPTGPSGSWEVPVDGGDPALVWSRAGEENRSRDVVTHRTILNWISWYQEDAPKDAGSDTVQWAHPSSPLFVHELASAWSTGGCLLLPDHKDRGPAERLVQFTATMSAHRLVLPSSLLSRFARTVNGADVQLDRLRQITAVGLPVGLCASVKAFYRGRYHCTLNTISGPRASLHCTGNRRTGPVETWDSRPLLGRPLLDARVYVLDHGRRLVGTGAPGELYLGGRLVNERARTGGTDGDPARWTKDPFSDEAGAVLYRTGQPVRFTGDGTLALLGRERLSGDGPPHQAWPSVSSGGISGVHG